MGFELGGAKGLLRMLVSAEDSVRLNGPSQIFGARAISPWGNRPRRSAAGLLEQGVETESPAMLTLAGANNETE